MTDFDNPDLLFFDWEDRALAVFKWESVFRVFSDKTLAPARADLSPWDIRSNGTRISKEAALKLAPVRASSKASV